MAGPHINDGGQVEKYLYDFADDAGATGELVLSDKANKDSIPNGSIVTDLMLHVETAVTSGGSLTLDVGNGDDPNGYLVAVAVAALTLNSVHRAGSTAGALIWDDTNDHYLGVHVADAADGECSQTIVAAAATAGRYGIYMYYVRGLSV